MKATDIHDDSPEYETLRANTIRQLKERGGSYLVIAVFMEEGMNELYKRCLYRAMNEGVKPKDFLTGWMESIGAISGQILALLVNSDEGAKQALATMGYHFMSSAADSFKSHQETFHGRHDQTEH